MRVHLGCTQSLVWDLYHIQGLGVRVLSYNYMRETHTARRFEFQVRDPSVGGYIWTRARDNPVRFFGS